MSRPICALNMAISIVVIKMFQGTPIDHVMLVFSIIFLGMWGGLVLGWGKYLNILSGNMQYVNEKEVKPIDWLATKLYGFPKESSDFIRWCFVAFSLRGMMFYPVFIGLSFYNTKALFYGVGCILMGVIYYAAGFTPVGFQVRAGEIMYGALLGLLIALSV